MNTQTETKRTVKPAKTAMKVENPLQERYCNEVTEAVEMTAEAVFTARRLEVREEASAIFVP